jgi:hypothetical protein
MAKAEISWKRMTAEGVKLQVYARRVGGDWRFFARERRFEQWEAVPEPPLEDWLELLDAVQRLITRRRLQPVHEEQVRRRIRERFPEANVQPGDSSA